MAPTGHQFQIRHEKATNNNFITMADDPNPLVQESAQEDD
jgi:hypothetical protein